MFLARDLGLWDERNVRLVELLANTDTMRALASGQLHAAALTLDELLSARADGVDLRVLAVLDVSAGADVVLARPQISINNLAGKRVGVEDSAMGAVMLSALLSAAGLTVTQIRKVSVTLDRSEEAFGNGLVDVIVTAEPWAARMEKRGAKRIFDSAAIPGRVVDVLAARAEVLEAQGRHLQQLISGHFQARAHFLAQPQDASIRMAARLQTPQAEVVAGFKGLQLPDAAENRKLLAPGGTFERVSSDLQRVMVAAGLLSRVADLRELCDDRFLPRLGGSA
jgi:NitT/TauT family transport system substrate-binding protein